VYTLRWSYNPIKRWSALHCYSRCSCCAYTLSRHHHADLAKDSENLVGFLLGHTIGYDFMVYSFLQRSLVRVEHVDECNAERVTCWSSRRMRV